MASVQEESLTRDKSLRKYHLGKKNCERTIRKKQTRDKGIVSTERKQDFQMGSDVLLKAYERCLNFILNML